MKLITLPLLFYVVSAAHLSPELRALEKEIWENTNLLDDDILILPQEERLATLPKIEKWPNGVIPYEIDSSAVKYTNSINKAIRYIQNTTCLRFKHSTSDLSRIKYVNSIYCRSYLGRKGVPQPVELANFCNSIGGVMHETLHAAGFAHEHNRSDRDDYIIVNLANILPDSRKSFRKYDESNILLTEYDIDSIMHYGEYNGAYPGRKALVSKIPGVRIRGPETKHKLSDKDIEKVKEFYSCP